MSWSDTWTEIIDNVTDAVTGANVGLGSLFPGYGDTGSKVGDAIIGGFTGGLGNLPEAAENAPEVVKELLGDNSGAGAPADDEILDENGLFKSKKLQQAKDLIDATTKYNNEWSAQQAQIQRDFQERMARNAHLYEVQDLKNAGLNPVLSAGGSGAATPSGAMGQTDTSNTRLMAELAMTAIGGAAGAAGAAGAVSGPLGWINKNRNAINTIISGIRTGIGIVKLFV